MVKYQLLETPKKKCSLFVHSWAIFGLVILSLSIALISLIIIWDQIKQIQHKTETLDFLLFGPKRQVSDAIRFSEYRALLYSLAANNSEIDSANITETFTSNERVETYQHVTKNYSLVCYYVTPNRSGFPEKIYPKDIDPQICTHLIVSFATVENNRLHFIDGDTMDAIVQLRLKNRNLKILLSVVSFNTADQEFASMITNQASRSQFISSALQFINEFKLDGIDLDWEFPAWPPGKDPAQKDQFGQLLKEMRDQFKSELLITVAVAAPLTIIKQSYDVPSIAKYVDFVNIMSYDYHSFVWYLPFVGLNSPLYNGPSETGYFSTLNINFTVHEWIKLGMPREKMMLGIPLYGHSWTLANPVNHNIGDLASNFGSIGGKGFVSYKCVCKFINSTSVNVEFCGEMRAPYAYKDSEWFSYEDELSVKYKAEYVTEHGLGGAMVFSLNQDDFDGNVCGKGKFPLLSQVRTVLSEDVD